MSVAAAAAPVETRCGPFAVRWSMIRALWLARYLSLTVSAATPLGATQANAADTPTIVAAAATPL